MKISNLKSLLDTSILLNGDENKAIEACDRMYEQAFRTEPFTISSFLQYNDDFNLDELKQELLIELSIAYYEVSGECKVSKPTKPDLSDVDCEYERDAEMDNYFNILESYSKQSLAWLKNQFPDFKINNDTELVTLCNYKGEGEGEPVLFETNKHLPVFISKNDSFFQANY